MRVVLKNLNPFRRLHAMHVDGELHSLGPRPVIGLLPRFDYPPGLGIGEVVGGSCVEQFRMRFERFLDADPDIFRHFGWQGPVHFDAAQRLGLEVLILDQHSDLTRGSAGRRGNFFAEPVEFRRLRNRFVLVDFAPDRFLQLNGHAPCHVNTSKAGKHPSRREPSSA